MRLNGEVFGYRGYGSTFTTYSNPSTIYGSTITSYDSTYAKNVLELILMVKFWCYFNHNIHLPSKQQFKNKW